jgi:ribosomal protein L28
MYSRCGKAVFFGHNVSHPAYSCQRPFLCDVQTEDGVFVQLPLTLRYALRILLLHCDVW